VTDTATGIKARARSARTETPSGRKSRDTAISSSVSSPDRVVDAIVQGIRLGRYVPGQKLIEADLSHELNLGRSPVREAFKRLAVEGIVTLTRHRGAYIRALTRTEADETLVVLEVLTGLMARLAAEAASRGGHGERIRQAYESLKIYKDRQRADIDNIDKRRHFYDTLAELGGNPQLARILPTMQIHLLRLQVQPYMTAARLGEQLRDYAEITEAVLAGNARRAERAMRKHIRRARARYLQLPDEAFRIPDGEG
jgi:DNA-binding GntR family transcriptional regulator